MDAATTEKVMSLKCDVCGDPAMTSVSKDPFGKSDAVGNFCAVHAPAFSALRPLSPGTDRQPTSNERPWSGCKSNDTGYHRPDSDGVCSDCDATRPEKALLEVASTLRLMVASGVPIKDSDLLQLALSCELDAQATAPETRTCAKFRIGDDVVVTRWHAPAKIKGFIYELEEPFQYPERERDLSPPAAKTRTEPRVAYNSNGDAYLVDPTPAKAGEQCHLHPDSVCPDQCQGGRKCVREPLNGGASGG
jgi:hypothetical protein